jgi:hypothetical protein
MFGDQCQHPDVRKFDGLRCCLACGEVVFETLISNPSSESSLLGPSHYEYTDLNYTLGQEIRLCVVLPGEPADQLQCEMIHVNLEDEPEYEAVSYTWASESGDATLSQSVNCGGNRYISVTANCEAALRQLRKRGLKRRLWIDAISINQANINERNHQVGLMDRIYSRARSVRICVQEHSFPPTFSNYRRLFDWLQDGSIADVEEVETWLLPMMMHLLSMRYFRRVWVVQEVVFAKAAYLLVNNDELRITWGVLDRFNLFAWRNRYQLPGVLLRWNEGQKPLADIVACLRTGIDCDCTDPRDKVFAVLSFMDPQARSLILVDYSLDVLPVYASAVVAVIASHRNLDILSHAGYVNHPFLFDWRTSPALTMDQFKEFLVEKDSRKQLHSNTQLGISSEPADVSCVSQFGGDEIGPWRANVEVSTVDEMVTIPNLVVENAFGPTVFCARPHHPASMNILPRFHVRAHYVDNICETWSSSLGVLNAGRFAKSMYKSPAYLSLAKYAWLLPFFQISRTPVLMDTLFSLGKPLGALCQDDLPDINLADMVEFVEKAMEQGSNKEIFTTTNSVGFARHGFESSDEIWAVDGARTPFVLRKTGPRIYRIVSDCYLWAALELDYWNPGTRKGRWIENRPAHDDKQTHIIEIY